MSNWDHQSGIRERLALLAAVGPSLVPHSWGYHPSRDYWYSCGPDAPKGRHIAINQEGAASLALIAQRWGIAQPEAMGLIGYPEGK